MGLTSENDVRMFQRPYGRSLGWKSLQQRMEESAANELWRDYVKSTYFLYRISNYLTEDFR